MRLLLDQRFIHVWHAFNWNSSPDIAAQIAKEVIVAHLDILAKLVGVASACLLAARLLLYDGKQ
ncbi:hypothetical protein D3C80_1929540 [compost metagenome]